MFHKHTYHVKLVRTSFLALTLASLIYAYNTHGAPVDRGIHLAMNAVSVSKYWQYYQVKSDLSRFEKAAPAVTAAAGQTQDGTIVLLYHGLVERPDRFNMTEATFRDQMFSLKAAGYRTVSMEEFIASIKTGRKLPAKSFLLTFDDGRRDSYVNADPILKATGFKATMFVAVEDSLFSNFESYYIAPNDIRDMIASGRWDIESHAVQETGGYVPVDAERRKGNFLSNKAWLPTEGRLESDDEYRARLAREIGGSKTALEAFGIKVDALAYPFGDYGNQTHDYPGAIADIHAEMSKHYSVGFRQVWPNDGEYDLNYPDADPLTLKRMETPTEWTGAKLLKFFETSADKPLPYAIAQAGDDGWMGDWGVSSIDQEGKGVLVSAVSNTAGADVFLDGTKTWKDYTAKVTLDRLKGTYVTLMAHYQDSHDYLACSFGEGHAKIDDYVQGVATHLADEKDPYDIPENDARLGIRVNGAQVDCLVGGMTVASATASAETSGGIGVRVWDRALNNGVVRLKTVDVSPIAPSI